MVPIWFARFIKVIDIFEVRFVEKVKKFNAPAAIATDALIII